MPEDGGPRPPDQPAAGSAPPGDGSSPPAPRWAPPPPLPRGHIDEERPTGVLRAVGADSPTRTGPRWLPDPPVRRPQGARTGVVQGPPRVGAPPPPPAGTPIGGGGYRSPGATNGRLPEAEAEAEEQDPPSRRRRTRIVETFQGPRLRSHTGPWRRIRSGTFLIIVTALVALVVAGVLAGIVGAIAFALHHASAGA